MRRAFLFAGTASRSQRLLFTKYWTIQIYYGDFRWNGKVYRGVHEPLISKKLFDRIREAMFEKSRRQTHPQKYNWAFQGSLACGHCGWTLSAEIKKKHYIYYHFTGNKGKCPEKIDAGGRGCRTLRPGDWCHQDGWRHAALGYHHT